MGTFILGHVDVHVVTYWTKSVPLGVEIPWYDWADLTFSVSHIESGPKDRRISGSKLFDGGSGVANPRSNMQSY